MPVDLTDPCARAAALREEYHRRLTGQSATRVSERAGDNAKEIWISEVSIDALLTEIRAAEAECAAMNGGAPRRFAIRAGSRRVC